MIDDPELRSIFKIEFEENIQTLNNELLKLESDVFNTDALTKLMRTAHSMKGGARMIGLPDVVTLAHFFEDMLGAVKKEGVELKRHDFDRMYKAIDIIKSLVNEAVTGEAPNFVAALVIDQIINGSGEPKTNDEPDSVIRQSEIAADSQPVTQELQGDIIPAFSIDTIRVASTKLDTLMDLSGELTVSKIQLALRLGKINDLSLLLEDSTRELNSIETALLPQRSENPGLFSEVGLIINRLKNRFDSASVEIGNLSDGISEDNSRLNFVAYEFEEVIKNLRMLKLSNIFNLYPRMVRDISNELGKEVNFIIEGGDITADKKILEEMRDPLMHMIRNSIDHGIELPDEREQQGKPRAGTIKLSANHFAGHITITLEDDGKGLNEKSIIETALRKKLIDEEASKNLTHKQIHKLIFTPGFSTSKIITDVSGRGVGMEVVQANIDKLKGKINIESETKKSTRFIIELPLTLATLRVMTASVGNHIFAIPVDFIVSVIIVDVAEVFSMEARDTIVFRDEPITIVNLKTVLELEDISDSTRKNVTTFQCIILSSMGEKAGFIVDSLIDEQEVLVKPLGFMLKRVKNVSGSTILVSGDVCMILNPNDLLKTVKSLSASEILETSTPESLRKKRILLVEDSITTRTQEKRILESAGYDVVVAVDGLDGYQKLLINEIDAVVSDVEMPNLDGLSLTEKIRAEKKYLSLPVVLVTSLSSEEQKKRGLESGANAYLTKSGFDQKILIETLDRLL
ncbi:MAG: hybrid sensor histidine kinase/response regulator [Ignavibacteriaceae bacterium]|nr:hybrid sensor histidine kinase/response regulator [Ignavibacteriaceae bacterium]